jgi:hypothetical protein
MFTFSWINVLLDILSFPQNPVWRVLVRNGIIIPDVLPPLERAKKQGLVYPKRLRRSSVQLARVQTGDPIPSLGRMEEKPD